MLHTGDAIVTNTFDIVVRAHSRHNARTNVVLPQAVCCAVTGEARIFFGNIFSSISQIFLRIFFAMGALPAQKAGLRY
jgi:hypothetical protein